MQQKQLIGYNQLPMRLFTSMILYGLCFLSVASAKLTVAKLGKALVYTVSVVYPCCSMHIIEVQQVS